MASNGGAKRSHENGTAGSPDAKKPRMSDGPVASSSSATSAAEELARKKALVAAKFAAMRAKTAAPAGPAASTSAQNPAAAKSAQEAKEALQRKIAETARKLQSQQGGAAAHPFLALLQQRTSEAEAKVGGIHPLLRTAAEEKSADEPYSQSKKDRYKPMAPKFATTRANQRAAPIPSAAPKPTPAANRAAKIELERGGLPTLEEARANPYFDRRLGVETLAPKSHRARPLRFAPRGKFEKIAEEKRREAHMEEVKRRVLESARKAGMEAEVDAASSARIRKQPPPEIEWWDAAYLPTGSYDDVESGVAHAVIFDLAKVGPDHAAITSFIQHPIPLPAPQDKVVVTARPLDLTPKEQKKLRRTERQKKFKDRQDRQRMGLLPPDPPKVKLSNMMRVLTQEAVLDPSKVEARVRREMTARQDAHATANAERKLTHEEKVAKIEAKKEADEAMGIFVAVFKVLNLSNGQHKFKIRKNAEQHNLTGCTLFNPKFALVVVEGGQKGIKAFTKLMLRRINWTEEAQSRDNVELADGGEYAPKPVKVEDEFQRPMTDIRENRCELIFSGQHRDRLFTGFRPKNCETDHVAREYLGERAAGYWDIARRERETAM